MTARTRRGIAVHEAGHAVAAIVLAQSFEYVEIAEGTLDDGRKYHGRVHYAESASYPAVQLAMTCLAGPIAQARFSRQSVDGILFGGGADDYFRTKEVLEHSRCSFDDAEACTRRLVSKHWGSIVAVANALIGRGRLEHADVAMIVRRS